MKPTRTYTATVEIEVPAETAADARARLHDFLTGRVSYELVRMRHMDSDLPWASALDHGSAEGTRRGA